MAIVAAQKARSDLDGSRFPVCAPVLLSDDPGLLALAQAASEPIGAIRTARDRETLAACENQAEDSLSVFITAAAAQLRK